MKISVINGTGTGPTPLAAFDAALMAAHIGNYNLIPLSSIIPPDSVVECTPYLASDDDYGHRLYVVISQQMAVEPGQEAWAGLGWAQEPANSRGLFVELHGFSEKEVKEDIRTTLQSMMLKRQGEYGPICEQVVGTRYIDQPVCAIVVAVYESQGWHS